jgi:hypothetical protein
VSATIKPSLWGGAIGNCPKCNETIGGASKQVQVWTEVHNDENHPEEIHCPAQTYRQTRDSPAEYCENEVADYGDLCPEHDYADAGAADDAREHDRESRLGY